MKTRMMTALGLLLMAAAWILAMADSGVPVVSLDVVDQSGEISIDVQESPYGCLPVVSVSKPVRQIHVLDETFVVIADARCLAAKDCLSSVSFVLGDGGPGCVLDGAFETGGAGDSGSPDTSSEVVVGGGGAGSGVTCEGGGVNGDDTARGGCLGVFQVVATTSDGKVSKLSFERSSQGGSEDTLDCDTAGTAVRSGLALLDLLISNL
jgi:hypothetical protein